jgi:plastocyanin
MINRLLAASTVLGIVAVLAGCNSSASKNSQYTGPEPAAVVKMQFHTFQPPQVAIQVGQTVMWNNTSLIWHTVTFDPAKAKEPSRVGLPKGAEPFDSGKMEPGRKFWHTFDVPGIYHYICRPHEESGMTGMIIVEKAPGG